MRFLADMGVSMGTVFWLRQRGHDVVHLREQKLDQLPDRRVFEKAAAEERIILTFDLDFGELVALSGSSVVSVIVFRINNATTAFVINRLESVLKSAAEALKRGAIVIVEDARHRIRKLPIGS